jgi:L,D-peptidoglycan transpeptidase YkuD (ErfK/YbiS/YcfS/YnhG family)
LWMLPYQCPVCWIKLQVCYISVSNPSTELEVKILSPGGSHCRSFTWKGYNSPSCSICQTVLREASFKCSLESDGWWICI